MKPSPKGTFKKYLKSLGMPAWEIPYLLQPYPKSYRTKEYEEMVQHLVRERKAEIDKARKIFLEKQNNEYK